MTRLDAPITYYPVLFGLSCGNHVVTNGAFLIDAETRLNPAAGKAHWWMSMGRTCWPALLDWVQIGCRIGDLLLT
jgi:hypothetical protein